MAYDVEQTPSGLIVTPNIGPNGVTLSVGKGGYFAELETALQARDEMGHELLFGGLTGSITYTAGIDTRTITLSTPVTNEQNSHIGVRIGGSGPILRCSLIGNGTTTTLLRLFYPIHQTYSGVQIDIYKIKHVGLSIVPGSRIELPNSSSRTIPPFTTIFCPVHKGASIAHVAATSGGCFNFRFDHNEVWLRDLVLECACGNINSLMFNWSSGFPQTDVGFIGCHMSTQSQDLQYFSGGGLHGGFHLIGNHISGTYDAASSPVMARLFRMMNNVVIMDSRGDYDTGAGDGGEPTGVVFGANSGEASTYPSVMAMVRNNEFHIRGESGGLGEGVKAVAVEIRSPLPSQAVVDVSSNYIDVQKHGGSGSGSAAGLLVGAVPGTATPTIIARNNTIRSVHTGGATGIALSMTSGNSNYQIKRGGNLIIAGSLGSNTTAATLV